MDLREAAERITGRRVDYVVNSHRHGDHVRGNQVFAEARVVATTRTRDDMDRLKKTVYINVEVLRRENERELEKVLATPDDPDTVLQEGYIRGALEGLQTLSYTLPDITFDTSLKFYGSKTNAEALTYRGGHTESDSLLYLADQGIAFLGDLLFIDYQPYLADGDPGQLLRILDNIEALDAKTLVPGHGPVGTSKDIAPLREYVIELKKTVEEVKTSGGGPKQAAEKPIGPRFNAWKWRGFYKDNLEFLFRDESRRKQE